MQLEKCQKCPHHIDSVADCALCKYHVEVEHKVIYQGKVVGCPLESEKKKR